MAALSLSARNSALAAVIAEVRQSLYGEVGNGTRNWKITPADGWAWTIPALPDPLEVNADDGKVYANGTARWSTDGDQLTISVDANLHRTGIVDAIAALGYELEFSVDVDTPTRCRRI
ncbi:MAG: hypothetical protein AB7U97_02130 [Pirellulales bacterium]